MATGNNKKRVLLDSSVWVSFFGKDTNTEEAKKIVSKLDQNRTNIVIPTIIYLEVMNNLVKIDRTGTFLKEARAFFRRGNIFIINPSKEFWCKRTESYFKKIRLKTMDLAILAFCFEKNINRLYTFDVKLAQAYKYLNQDL